MFNSNPNNQYISNKKISIFPRAQANYGRGGTGKNNLMRFNIPQYHGYILPDQCYLKFNYIQDEGGIGQVQPDPRAGFHSLFSTVRTTSGDGMALIEEVDDYNSLQSSLMSYTKNDSIENRRQLYEGFSPTPLSPTFSLFNEQPPAVNALQSAALVKKKVEAYMPINTGALSLNPTILPVVALNGVDIELQLDNIRRSLVYTAGSLGFSERQGGTALTKNGVLLTAAIAQGNTTIFYANPLGIPGGPPAQDIQPFDVGDQLLTQGGAVIGTVSGLKKVSVSSITLTAAAPTTVTFSGVVGTSAIVGATSVTVTSPSFPRIPLINSSHHTGLYNGLTLSHTAAGTGTVTTLVVTSSVGGVLTVPALTVAFIQADTITIAAVPNYTFEVGAALPAATPFTVTAPTAVFGNPAVVTAVVEDSYTDAQGVTFVETTPLITTPILINTILTAPSAVSGFEATLAAGSPLNLGLGPAAFIYYNNAVREPTIGYTMSQVQLVCTVVTPPQEYVARMMTQIQSGAGLNLDIKTFSTYRNNVIDNNGVTTQLIPAITKRAYSILSLPLNNTLQRTYEESAYTPYITGQQQYQYIHSNMLIPDREVQINERVANFNHGFSAVYTNEIDKALSNCGYTVRNLRNQKDFFMIGREFSKQGQVYNLHEGDLSLRIFYIGAEAARLFLHYVCHLQRININRLGISVVS